MKKKKEKLPMTTAKKAILIALLVVVVAVLIYVAYYLIHYTFFNKYRDYVTSYEYEQGEVYSPLADSDIKVKGFDLVAENDKLKLYTQPSTGYVAVYDKRNDSITYSNPLKADEDKKANAKMKAYMKSAFRLDYFNSNGATGTYETFNDSVKKNQMTCESIKNGVRYIYTIGEFAPDKPTAIYFEVPLEYRLTDDSIEVSIPTNHIKEDGAGYVYRIMLLQYFGAAHNDEEGYLVVPNGSGSLIRFNNGKTQYANYSQYFYDIDPLVANYTSIENVKSARLPIYGICREDRSVLVNITDGATVANVTAGISGAYNEYNYAYTTFVIRNTDNLKMFGTSSTDVYVVEDNLYDINLTARYTFLTEENKGYAGIANYYRNKLIADGSLKINEKSDSIPFFYDILAGVEEATHVLGVGTLKVMPMTTFDQASEIAKDLSAAGLSNQVVNLQGWFNDGYYHDTPNRIKVTHKLGGKSDLKKLNETIASLGGHLYVDVMLTKASTQSNFNGANEASRYYGAGFTAMFGLVNPTTLRSTTGLGYRENIYYVVSPKFLVRYAEKFADKITDYPVDGISLRDLGSYVASDKKRTNVISREQALDVVLHEFNVMKDTDKKLLVNKANDYAFPYADYVLNASVTANDYFIVDEQIPLYGMILHGTVDYSSDLLNYTDNQNIKSTLLNLVENGAAPHYVFTWENSSKMKDSGLNRFYATTYSYWKDDAVSAYEYVNGALKYVTNACIVNHEIIDKNVRVVTYDNGVKIYVNYNKTAATVNGIQIPAESYLVEGR